MIRGRRWLVVLTLAPLLVAGTCRKKDPEEPEGDYTVRTPEVNLQVISVDPDVVTANRAFTVTVYGSAFTDAAEVMIGDREATKVGFRNSNTLTVSGPAIPEGSYDVTVINPATRERSVLRGALESRVRGSGSASDACRSATLYFEYNASRLTGEASRDLSQIASCLSGVDWSVKLEGHADERGTTEYNLALGQRRANSVKDALANQGVSPARIHTTSYGEERPAERGTGEAVWSKNRRVELKTQE